MEDEEMGEESDDVEDFMTTHWGNRDKSWVKERDKNAFLYYQEKSSQSSTDSEGSQLSKCEMCGRQKGGVYGLRFRSRSNASSRQASTPLEELKNLQQQNEELVKQVRKMIQEQDMQLEQQIKMQVQQQVQQLRVQLKEEMTQYVQFCVSQMFSQMRTQIDVILPTLMHWIPPGLQMHTLTALGMRATMGIQAPMGMQATTGMQALMGMQQQAMGGIQSVPDFMPGMNMPRQPLSILENEEQGGGDNNRL